MKERQDEEKEGVEITKIGEQSTKHVKKLCKNTKWTLIN